MRAVDESSSSSSSAITGVHKAKIPSTANTRPNQSIFIRLSLRKMATHPCSRASGVLISRHANRTTNRTLPLFDWPRTKVQPITGLSPRWKRTNIELAGLNPAGHHIRTHKNIATCYNVVSMNPRHGYRCCQPRQAVSEQSRVRHVLLVADLNKTPVLFELFGRQYRRHRLNGSILHPP